MALTFSNSKGSAKAKVDYYALVDGPNSFRILPGTILAMYTYWLPRASGKNLPVECLSFDRDLEKFTNIEKDWSQHYFPEIKCSWAYACQVVNKAGDIKVLTLKKKMFEQIMEAADDLGDPTDLKKGWDCIVTRKKTGPLAYNVEYTLNVLKCKTSAVSEDIVKKWKEGDTIDNILPRPTADEQHALIKAQCLKDDAEANVDEDAADEAETNFDDDISF